MRKTKPWNVMYFIKTKEQLDAYVEAAVEPYKKALIKATDGLNEISKMDIWARYRDVMENKLYAEYLRKEIIQDLKNEGITLPIVKNWKSLYRLRRRDSKKIINFKERINEDNSKA